MSIPQKTLDKFLSECVGSSIGKQLYEMLQDESSKTDAHLLTRRLEDGTYDCQIEITMVKRPFSEGTAK